MHLHAFAEGLGRTNEANSCKAYMIVASALLELGFTFYLLLDTPGMDVSKYVKPSLSLIDAHILAENGVSEHSDYTKNASTMLTLMRTINALLVGLGPEIATNEGATLRFFAVFHAALDTTASQPMMIACLKFLSEMATFNHSALLEQNDSLRDDIVAFVKRALFSSQFDARSRVIKAAAKCALCITKRNAFASASFRDGLFACLEAHGRQSFELPLVPLTLCGNGSYLSMRNGARTVDSRANVVRRSYVPLRLSIGDDRTAISSWFQFCRSVLVGSTNSGSGEREDDNGSDDDNDNGNNGGATKSARGNAKTRSGWGGLNDEDAQYGAWCAISNAEARWQTKICALELLRDILCTLKSTGEHIDLGLARKIQKHKQKPFASLQSWELFVVACSLAGDSLWDHPLNCKLQA